MKNLCLKKWVLDKEGKSSKEGNIEGKDVVQAFLDGRIEEICAYCRKDVELTQQIYRKMVFLE